ncbi:VOC family protein, partial [Clostridium perfringens]
MTRPPLYGVGIFVPVSDLKRSTAWYTEMLGLEIIHKDEPDAIVMRMNYEKVSFCLVRTY